MAGVKKIIEIDVETLRAQGGLDTFIGSLKETETQSISLKAQLRQLKEQLASLPEGTAEYNRVAQEAGNLSDKIGDINTQVKNLGSDTKGIDTVVQGAQTLSGAFTIASSASALLGVENEDLQQTMLKVESAIGLTVGIQSVANALQKESALMLGITSTATKIQTGLQLAYTAVVGTTTGALKLLRIALVSTGIGAIVVLLGALIGAMDSATESTNDQKDAQDALNDSLDKSNDLYKESISNLKDVTKERLLRAKIAGASEKELANIEKESAKEREQNYKIERDRLYAQLNDKKIGLEASKKINKALSDNQKEYFASLEQQKIKDLETDLSNAEKVREANQKAIEDKKKLQKEAQDERQKAHDKELEDLKKNADEIADAKLKKETELKEKAKAILKDIEEKNKPIETPSEKLQREFDENYKILKAAGESTSQLEFNFLAEKNRIALEAKMAGDASIKALDEKAAADKLTTEKNIKDALVSLGESTLSTLDSLEALGLKKSKATEGIRKGIALAQIATDSAMALSRALPMALEAGKAAAAVAGPSAPIVGPLVIATSLIGSAATIAKNVVNAKKLLSGGSASSAGGGGGGGGGGSTPAVSQAPQFNIVGNAGVNQIAQTLGKPQPPIQTFVVAGQVTTAQGLNRNIINNATL
jgi:hypothetical protein